MFTFTQKAFHNVLYQQFSFTQDSINYGSLKFRNSPSQPANAERKWNSNYSMCLLAIPIIIKLLSAISNSNWQRDIIRLQFFNFSFFFGFLFRVFFFRIFCIIFFGHLRTCPKKGDVSKYFFYSSFRSPFSFITLPPIYTRNMFRCVM